MNKQDEATDRQSSDIEQILSLSDEELSHDLEHRWENGDFDTAHLTDEERDTIFADISSRIFPGNEAGGPLQTHRLFVRKAMKYAAAVLLPVLLSTTLYFYWQANKEVDCLTTIATGRGERASVTLPDGTEVKINNESSVSYNPYSYAKGKREVSMEGEAFFEVKSDRRYPFSVTADGLCVNVVGTKFNVNARRRTEPSVYLEEGSVRLTAAGETIEMSPGQVATYDSAAGVITISEESVNNLAVAWLDNEMVFDSKPIEEVVSVIEQCYGVEFDKYDIKSLPTDGFTGTLPSDDLAVVLDVLEDVYGVKFTLKERKIVLSR